MARKNQVGPAGFGIVIVELVLVANEVQLVRLVEDWMIDGEVTVRSKSLARTAVMESDGAVLERT